MPAIKNILLDKLQKKLTDLITNTDQVLYIMVQIRKIIELEKKNFKGQSHHPYPYLFLYASWLLHTDIDHDYQSQQIIQQLDKEVKNYIEKYDSGYEKQLLPIIISPEKIKVEMKGFLNNYKLPNDILDNSQWKDFSKLLLTELLEVPLIPKSSNKIEYIDKIYYEKAPEPTDHSDPRKRVYPTLIFKLKKSNRGQLGFPSHEPYIY